MTFWRHNNKHRQQQIDSNSFQTWPKKNICCDRADVSFLKGAQKSGKVAVLGDSFALHQIFL